MITGTNQRVVKVYFKNDSWWSSNGCDCCEPSFMECWNFSHIEGVGNPDKYQSYDYEMYNGSKGSEWDCLVSVFWDLVADKRQHDHFYDMYEILDDLGWDDIVNMLSDKSIEVVFLED